MAQLIKTQNWFSIGNIQNTTDPVLRIHTDDKMSVVHI